MELKELNTFKDYITYDLGYRIVYFYDNHHEARFYSKTLEGFNDFLEEKEISKIDDLLNNFLTKDEKTLGVAIYDIKGNLIAKETKNNLNIKMEVYPEELIYDYNDVIKKDGFRIVYFYPDNSYKFGSYALNIEDFMFDFTSYEPITDYSDVPRFISISDLLDKYLESVADITGVAIYKVDGTLVAKKEI